jgi:V8-like Glu-specific endopeptidase
LLIGNRSRPIIIEYNFYIKAAKNKNAPRRRQLLTIIGFSLLLAAAGGIAASQAQGSATIFSPGPEADSAVAEPAPAVPPLLVTPDLSPSQPGKLLPLSGDNSPEESEIVVAPKFPTDGRALRSSRVNSRPHGKVYAVWRGTGVGECSGVLITGQRRPVLLTAAHCVLLIEPGSRPRKADYLTFIPALKPGRAPFGTYRISKKDIYIKPGVARQIKAKRFHNDWAFLRLPQAKKLQRYVGSDGAVFNPRRLPSTNVSLIGYPGSQSTGNGQKKRSCDARILGYDSMHPHPRPFVSSCSNPRMARGVSGGGWRWPAYRSSRVLSLTAYKNTYIINKKRKRLASGVRLTSDAHRAYRQASG